MRSVLQHLLGLLAVPSPSSMIAAVQPSCSPFPSTIINFSSAFQQPNPPSISAEFKSSWRQHKWSLNVNISHITSGFLYNSPTLKKVRVDEAYDTTIACSLFNYNNISSNGLVSNIMYSFSPSIASKPTFFSDFVNPNFPLFAEDMLVGNEAVYTGLIERANSDIVASWSIMYQGAIPVKVFVDECGTVVGYDYFSPNLRTRVVTEFFNVVIGPIADEVFEIPG